MSGGNFLGAIGLRTLWRCLSLFFLVLLPSTLALAQEISESTMESCLRQELLSASDEVTVGELRSRCKEKLTVTAAGESKESVEEKSTAVEGRLRAEQQNVLRPFSIMAHRPNYFLAGVYNFSDSDMDDTIGEGGLPMDLDEVESQFQISFKSPLALNLLDTDFDLFTGYTLRAFWQVYDKELSSPFRETNHEPEVWLQTQPGLEFLGLTNQVIALGLNHQSNGRSGELSRSWNRFFANFIFTKGDFALSVRPWLRIEEGIENDDNPDITDFMGHGEIQMAYKLGEHTFSMMSRNNLESGFSRGAVELSWSFPFFDYPFLNGYIRYFSGYGESLIDYDRYVNRLGIGISLTDFL